MGYREELPIAYREELFLTERNYLFLHSIKFCRLVFRLGFSKGRVPHGKSTAKPWDGFETWDLPFCP